MNVNILVSLFCCLGGSLIFAMSPIDYISFYESSLVIVTNMVVIWESLFVSTSIGIYELSSKNHSLLNFYMGESCTNLVYVESINQIFASCANYQILGFQYGDPFPISFVGIYPDTVISMTVSYNDPNYNSKDIILYSHRNSKLKMFNPLSDSTSSGYSTYGDSNYNRVFSRRANPKLLLYTKDNDSTFKRKIFSILDSRGYDISGGNYPNFDPQVLDFDENRNILVSLLLNPNTKAAILVSLNINSFTVSSVLQFTTSWNKLANFMAFEPKGLLIAGNSEGIQLFSITGSNNFTSNPFIKRTGISGGAYDRNLSKLYLSMTGESKILIFSPLQPTITSITPTVARPQAREYLIIKYSSLINLPNLLSSYVTVLVANRPCSNIEISYNTVISCKLPIAIGENVPVLVDLVLPNQSKYFMTSTISFEPPVLVDSSLKSGDTDGGYEIFIDIDNLGDPRLDPVSVFIGENECKDLEVQNEKRVSCLVPEAQSGGKGLEIKAFLAGVPINNTLPFVYNTPSLVGIFGINEDGKEIMDKPFACDGFDELRIYGANFGIFSDSDIKIEVVGFGLCSGCVRDSHSRISCLAVPPGFGKNLKLSFTVSNRSWNLQSNFNYEAPIVSSIFPSTLQVESVYSIAMLGKNFGALDPGKNLQIKFSLIGEKLELLCQDVAWINDQEVRCIKFAFEKAGKYSIVVTVADQSFKTENFINVKPQTSNPIAYNGSLSLDQGAESVFVLRAYDPNQLTLRYFIDSFPSGGRLFQCVLRNSSNLDEKCEKGTILDVDSREVQDQFSKIIYVANEVNVFADHFSFYVVNGDGLRSTPASCNISVRFVNKLPTFIPPAQGLQSLTQLSLEQDVSLNTISDIDDNPGRIDYSATAFTKITIVIEERDETDSLYLVPMFVSGKGKWDIAGVGQSIDWSKGVLRIGVPKDSYKQPTKSYDMFLRHDGLGASYPYATLSIAVFDSFTYAEFRNNQSNSLISEKNHLNLSITVVCDTGLYANVWSDKGRICARCPNGAICNADGKETITNKLGFYAVTRGKYISCFPENACPVGSFDGGRNQTCPNAYRGFRCGKCQHGYFRFASTCRQCTSNNQAMALTIVLAVVIVFSIMGSLYLLRNINLGFISITVSFFQALSIFRGLKIRWTDFIVGLFNSLSILNFNLEIVQPECYMSDSSNGYEIKTYMTSVLPLISAVILALAFLCLKVLLLIKENVFSNKDNNAVAPKTPEAIAEETEMKSLGQTSDLIPKYVSGNIMILKYLYFALVFRGIQLYSCSYGDGYNFFEPEPDRRCFEDWWYGLFPISIFSMLFYGLGIPALFIYLHRLRIRIMDIPINARTRRDIFALQVTFRRNPELKAEYLYWEVIVMLRKVAIAMVQVFYTQNVAFQVVLYIMIFIFSLLLQNKYEPYAYDDLNQLESVTLFSSIIILLMGLTLHLGNNDLSANAKNYLSFMVFVFTLGSGVTIFKKVFTYLRNLMSGTGKRESLRIRGPAGIATVIRKKSVYYTYKQKQKRKVDQVSSDYALRPFPNQE